MFAQVQSTPDSEGDTFEVLHKPSTPRLISEDVIVEVKHIIFLTPQLS